MSNAISSATANRAAARRAVFGSLTLAGVLMTFIYYRFVFPWINRWGATDSEVQETLPGDELVAKPTYTTTHVVTVEATPEQIYPWLIQLGVDRGGMYSYTSIESILGLHVTNAERIHPEWQHLKVGDLVRFTPEDYFLNPGPGLWVQQMEPPHVLVFAFGMETQMPEPVTVTWQFVLRPQDDGSTRLILRGQNDVGSGIAAALAKLGAGPWFIMERQMLWGIKERAERMAARH